ncbi:hypothetical protein SDC9_113932 [bioreactor metagenome]|uniref:Uncharacterized protein n=1 Tax=bioreactor metagenome TaxID=1076179 RepID=A0A645BP55_9ZZZZ
MFYLTDAAYFLVQRIGRIIRLQHRICSEFEGGIKHNGSIFGRHKRFGQALKESFLLNGSYHRIALGDYTMLHALPIDVSVLLGDDAL